MPSLTTVRVHQLLDPDRQACAYLIECPRTRAAAVVDPTSAHSEPIALRVRARDLNLRFALYTRPRADPGMGEDAGRFTELVRSLGLAPTAAGAKVEGWSWPGIPVVEPTADPVEGRVLVSSLDSTFEILPQDGPIQGTLGGCCAPPRGRVHRARIALGVFHLEVIPIRGGADPWVAYRLRDRVFSGGSLLAGGRGLGDDGTPPRLLTLDDDDLVLPRRAPRRLAVSTVSQERAWSHAIQRSQDALRRAGP